MFVDGSFRKTTAYWCCRLHNVSLCVGQLNLSSHRRSYTLQNPGTSFPSPQRLPNTWCNNLGFVGAVLFWDWFWPRISWISSLASNYLRMCLNFWSSSFYLPAARVLIPCCHNVCFLWYRESNPRFHANTTSTIIFKDSSMCFLPDSDCCTWIWMLYLNGMRRQTSEWMNEWMFVYLIDQAASKGHREVADAKPHTHRECPTQSQPLLLQTLLKKTPKTNKISTSKGISGNELHIIKCFCQMNSLCSGRSRGMKKDMSLLTVTSFALNGFSKNFWRRSGRGSACLFCTRCFCSMIFSYCQRLCWKGHTYLPSCSFYHSGRKGIREDPTE